MAEINFTDNQKKALELDGGKLVLAGAGSGKTTVMSERYLRLLEEKRVEPRNIVAITFTKKAAANLEDKIYSEIQKRIETDNKNKAFWLLKYEEMQWARIGTIHGFFTSLLRSYPIEAGVDPEFVVVGEGAKSSAKELEKLLVKKIYAGSEEHISLIGRFKKYTAFEECCRVLLNNDPVLSLLEQYEGRKEELVHFLNGTFSKIQQEFPTELNLEQHGDHSEFINLLYEIFNLIRPVLDRDKSEEKKELSFDDIEYFALKLLRSESKILGEITRHISALLVDEFQDTSTIQWELIKLLCSNNEGNFCSDKVFFVGDEKQSIYGFRGANVTNVREAEKEFQRTSREDEKWTVNLNDNFRTQKNITDKINKLFEKILVPEDKVSKAYEARAQSLDAKKEVPEGVGSSLEFYYTEKGGDEELYSSMVSKIVADVEGGKVLVSERDGHGSDSRKLNYTDIGILVKSWSSVPKIEEELKSHGVPYTVVGGKGFLEKQEVKDLKNTIKAFVNPMNKIPVLGVLRGPLFSFSDRQAGFLFKNTDNVLERWKNLVEGKSNDIKNLLETEEIEKLENGLQFWNETKNKFGSGKIVNTLLSALEKSGALAAYAVGKNGEQRLANIEKYLGILRDVESEGNTTLTTFWDALEETEKSFAENEAEADVSAGMSVKILTIFGAKGLEFPYVILPDLSSRRKSMTGFNELNKGNLVVEKSDLTVLTEPKMAIFAGGCKNQTPLIYNQMKETTARIENAAEEKRLLYVAMTRAKDHLLIFGHLKNIGGEANNTLLKYLTDALGITVEKEKKVKKLIVPEAPLITAINLDELQSDIEKEQGKIKEEPDAPLPEMEFYSTPVSEEFDASITSFYKFLAQENEEPGISVSKKESSLDDEADNIGMEIGTIVHEVLQKFGIVFQWEDVEETVEARVKALDIKNKTVVIESVKTLVSNIKLFGLQDSAGIVHNEIPIVFKLGNLTLHGKIDRAIIDNGRIEVFDYKTNAILAGEDKLTSRTMGYNHQICLYMLCLQKAWGIDDISGKLLYLSTGGTDEYTLTPEMYSEYLAAAERYIENVLKQ